MVDICQALKVLPTKNFRHGVMDGAENINAQTMHDTIFDHLVKETLRIEHQFNTDAGIAAINYRFCESFYEEAQPETGEKIDITDEESAQARKW
jgi:aldehyde:ferredoxin oxidoreductase